MAAATCQQGPFFVYGAGAILRRHDMRWQKITAEPAGQAPTLASA